MLVLAGVAGVASVPVTFPDGQQENLGIWWQANWSFTFVFVIPVLLYCVRLLSDRIEQSVADLVGRVLRKDSGRSALPD